MNRYKYILTILLLLCLVKQSISQDTFPLFNDGKSYSGISSQFTGFDIEGQTGFYFLTLGQNDIGQDLDRVFYTFGAYPKYNFFAPTDIYSFSVGSPMSIGIDFIAGSFGSFYGFMFDAPLVVDFNLGTSATRDNGYFFGIYGGGGLNYNFSTFGSNDVNYTNHLVGPLVHGGLRWMYNQSETGFRLSYMFQQPDKDTEVNGIQVSNPVNRFVFSINLIIGI